MTDQTPNPDTVDIFVGTSETNVKTIDLKELNIGALESISSTPINFQESTWGDKFEARLNEDGTILTVQRTDAGAGWGQELVLRGTLKPSKGYKTIIIILIPLIID